MKTFHVMRPALAAACAAICTAAQAALTWQTGSYTAADFTASEHNITPRAGLSKTSLQTLGNGNISDQVQLNNETISFEFPEVDLYRIRVFSYHQDAGRDGISISSVWVKYAEDGEWVNLGAPAVSVDKDAGRAYAFLVNSEDGEPIAEGIWGVRFVLPTQDHSGTNYSELELVGDESVDRWPAWSYGSYDAYTTFQDPSNVVSLASSDDAPEALLDGRFATTAQVTSGTNFTWTLAEPANLVSFALYTYGSDTSHDGISVAKIEYRTSGSSDWTLIPNSKVNYDANGKMQRCVLQRSDRSVLASDVTALRVTFGTQDNDYAYYGAFEARCDHVSPVSTWHLGILDVASWQSNVSNLLVGSTRTGGVAGLNNGAMEKGNEVDNNAVISWSIPVAATIYGVDIYIYHDSGRDRISVTKLELREDGSEDWIDLEAPAVWYDPNKGAHYARFDKGGAAFGTNIKELRITFGAQENNWGGYGEIELLGVLPATAAVLHDVVATPNVYTAEWDVRLTSVGGGDGATVNLWTSTNSQPFELSRSTVLTDIAQAAHFEIDYETFKTIRYKIELVNTAGGVEYRSTNDVKSITLYNNARYFWKRCESGTWQDASCWTNGYHNDARLGYPNVRTCTADLRVLGEGRPVTITATGYTEAKMTTLPANAVVTWKANGIRIDDFGACVVQGTNIYDGCLLYYQSGITTAANAYLKFMGGYSYGNGFEHCGTASVVEVVPGTSLDIGRGGIGNKARYVVDNATVSTSGAFAKGALTVGISCGGYVELKGKQPKFRDWGGHRMMGAGSNPPFTIRFAFPGRGWSEPAWGFTNVENKEQGGFGGGGGTWRLEVLEPQGPGHYGRDLELPLVEAFVASTSEATKHITTNCLSFVAYGTTTAIGQVLNRYGDRFYYTYDFSDALAPSAEGDLPTGIRFHFGARPVGGRVTVR